LFFVPEYFCAITDQREIGKWRVKAQYVLRTRYHG